MINVNNVQICSYEDGRLCIEPLHSRRQRPSWIMWVSLDGSAELYTKRWPNGAVVGDPIKLPANKDRKFDSAIASIANSLCVVEENAPINESAGNFEQAEYERSAAESFKAALTVLNNSD